VSCGCVDGDYDDYGEDGGRGEFNYKRLRQSHTVAIHRSRLENRAW